jgi:hypothetical protein
MGWCSSEYIEVIKTDEQIKQPPSVVKKKSVVNKWSESKDAQASRRRKKPQNTICT